VASRESDILQKVVDILEGAATTGVPPELQGLLVSLTLENPELRYPLACVVGQLVESAGSPGTKHMSLLIVLVDTVTRVEDTNRALFDKARAIQQLFEGQPCLDGLAKAVVWQSTDVEMSDVFAESPDVLMIANVTFDVRYQDTSIV